MSYMLHGKKFLGLASEGGHTLVAYAVRVAPSYRGRWASASCFCGAASRAKWEDTTADYRSLVMVAWYDACGSTARLDVESLPRLQ